MRQLPIYDKACKPVPTRLQAKANWPCKAEGKGRTTDRQLLVRQRLNTELLRIACFFLTVDSDTVGDIGTLACGTLTELQIENWTYKGSDEAR